MTLAKSEPNQVKKNDNKLPKLTTTQQPPVSEEEMRQAVRTLLLGLGAIRSLETYINRGMGDISEVTLHGSSSHL